MDSSQSRRAVREQQRKKTIRKWAATAAAATILLSGGGVVAHHHVEGENRGTSPSQQALPPECATTRNVTVETTPAMAQVLEKIPVDPEKCITLDVNIGESSEEVLSQAASGSSYAHLWIPDSLTRATLAMAEAKTELTPISDSLAQTIAVVVTATDTPRFHHWTDALADGNAAKMGDPQQNSGAFAAFMSGIAEVSAGHSSPEKLAEGTGLRATTIGVDGELPTSEDLLTQVEKGEIPAAIVTEAVFTRYRAEHGGESLKATAPGSSSAILDFPLYRTSTSTNSTIDGAAAQISNFMASDEGRQALSEAGLRPTGQEALEDGGALGSVTPLTQTNPEILERTWLSYSMQSAPLNALVILDASGSMLTPVEGTDKTRMDLMVDSALAGSQLFPARDSIGLWKFSRNLALPDGCTADYQKLVPVRGMEEEVTDGKTQRELLQEAGTSISGSIGSTDPTALHDTLLAGFRELKEHYEPGAANVVIMLTDGENYDEGSISQEELISTIQAEQDADEPVFILLIGISQDANMEALQTIASATGGEAYPALSPTDVQVIFSEGLTQVAAEKAKEATQ
ncbi:substrate-binding and VWA domain-containing protein [Rothia sp. P100]|uniref:substrate-binding domain-containing protein n=1 Tax=Rothia sp. P100 TaxID=2939578 RepID=UPI00203B734A|nr:substrate-binding and VWA domain-containing protein [Rothia sp. P100]